jgi:hypothetical protein
MSLQSQRELENTRTKLKQLEDRYAALVAQAPEAGQDKAREWTLLSLKKLINQFREEIARFQARAGSARES